MFEKVLKRTPEINEGCFTVENLKEGKNGDLKRKKTLKK